MVVAVIVTTGRVDHESAVVLGRNLYTYLPILHTYKQITDSPGGSRRATTTGRLRVVLCYCRLDSEWSQLTDNRRSQADCRTSEPQAVYLPLVVIQGEAGRQLWPLGHHLSQVVAIESGDLLLGSLLGAGDGDSATAAAQSPERLERVPCVGVRRLKHRKWSIGQ